MLSSPYGQVSGGTDDRFLSSVNQPALDHRHCSLASTRPAFSGLFSTYSIRYWSSTADLIQWSNDSSCQNGVPVRPRIWLATRAVDLAAPLLWHRVGARVAVSGLAWGYCLGRSALPSLSLLALIVGAPIAVNESTPRLRDALSARPILPLRRQVSAKMIQRRSHP